MRVLQPIVSRYYDPNPQGSATTQVTMAAAIPFQRQVVVVNKGFRNAGVAGLGDDGTVPGQVEEPGLDTSASGDGSDATDFAALTTSQDASYLPTTAPNNVAAPVQSAQSVPTTPAQSMWSSAMMDLTSGLTKAGGIVAQGAAQRLANRLTGQSATGKAMAAVGGAPNVLLLGGIALVAGWGLWSMLRAGPKGGSKSRTNRRYSGRRRAYA